MVSITPKTASVALTEEMDPDTGNEVIFGQRIAADGSDVGAPIQLTDSYFSSSAGSTLILADGGFELTYEFYDPSETPDNFGGYLQMLATEEVSPQGTIVGSTYIGTEGVPEYGQPSASLDQITALSTGGYAYISTTSTTYTDSTTFYAALDVVNAKGKDTHIPIVSRGTQFGPYPNEYYTQPVLQVSKHGTFEITYSTYYGESVPAYPAPSGSTTYEDIYTDDAVLREAIVTQPDGSKSFTNYNTAGKVTLTLVRSSDGSSTQTTFDPATGKALFSSTVLTDGSRTDTNNAVIGRPYATQTISYGTAGGVTALTRTYANGRTALSDVIGPDGSFSVRSFDTAGRETTRILIAADGAKEVVNSTYAGTGTSPSTIADYRYAPGDRLLSIDTTGSNGTHAQIAKAAGVTLTSTTGVADAFTAAGGDTFVFQPSFGQDMVTNFHAGAGAGHDTLQFDASIVSDFQHLSAAISQTKAGALITIDPTDSVLLKGVTASALTASDFSFKPHAQG